MDALFPQTTSIQMAFQSLDVSLHNAIWQQHQRCIINKLPVTLFIADGVVHCDLHTDYIPCIGFRSYMLFSVAGYLDRHVDKCSLIGHYLAFVVSHTLKFTAAPQPDHTHALISASVKTIVQSLTITCLATRAFWAMTSASNCELMPNSTSAPYVPWDIENSVSAGFRLGSLTKHQRLRAQNATCSLFSWSHVIWGDSYTPITFSRGSMSRYLTKCTACSMAKESRKVTKKSWTLTLAVQFSGYHSQRETISLMWPWKGVIWPTVRQTCMLWEPYMKMTYSCLVTMIPWQLSVIWHILEWTKLLRWTCWCLFDMFSVYTQQQTSLLSANFVC